MTHVSYDSIEGASTGGIDLLPSPSSTNSWTQGVTTDGGHAFDTVFRFDGKTTVVEIPFDEIEPDMGKRFTLSAWIRHERNEHDSNPHGTKEHIICGADGDGKSQLTFYCSFLEDFLLTNKE